MASPWDTDLDVFVADGDAITYGGVSIQCVWDDAYSGVVTQEGTIEVSVPSALVLSSDVAGVAHNETITKGAATYKITGIDPNPADAGAGFTRLTLVDSP